MLIRITNSCHMGCSHCFINATPHGDDMTEETFVAALRLTRRLGDPTLMISGGEPTDHPEIVRFIELAQQYSGYVLLLSNGMWLHDPAFDDRRERILELVTGVQVTNDPRYYPRAVARFVHPKVMWETTLRQISPHGRARTNGLEANRTMPLCFNLRSATRAHARMGGPLNPISAAILMLRQRGGFCTPSVNPDGNILAGEAAECCSFGRVTDHIEQLTRGVVDMKCNRCGLCDNLTAEQKAAIGET